MTTDARTRRRLMLAGLVAAALLGFSASMVVTADTDHETSAALSVSAATVQR